MSRYPVIIGRFEYIDVVDQAQHVPAKIDTGAYHSSIHVTHIKETTKSDGRAILRFRLLGHPGYDSSVEVEAGQFTRTTVRSSNGHQTERYRVYLKIRLGYTVFKTPFTLVDRTNNVFPILIGREALRNRYVVDVAKSGVKRIDLLKAARNEAILQTESLEGVNT